MWISYRTTILFKIFKICVYSILFTAVSIPGSSEFPSSPSIKCEWLKNIYILFHNKYYHFESIDRWSYESLLNCGHSLAPATTQFYYLLYIAYCICDATKWWQPSLICYPPEIIEYCISTIQTHTTNDCSDWLLAVYSVFRWCLA